jgi:hypothetical protein
MTGLLNVPFEILEQICELIAGSRPSDLKSFSEVSKGCLAASSSSLWRTVRLRTYAESTLEIVDKLKHILQTRLSRNARVRCISVSCRHPSNDCTERENVYHPKRVYLNDAAWHPLADLLAAIPTMDYHDSTFDLVSLTAIMQPPLPLLEHLSITVKRSKGNSDEVSMYKILGAMSRLQSIALGLDTSTSSQHMNFFAQRNEPASQRYLSLANAYAIDAFVNKAVDEKLAIAIFRTTSAAKPDRSLPLERLEVRPDCSSGEVLSYPFTDWSTLIERIERSWLVVRKYPGLGSEELSVSQIQRQFQSRKQSSPRMYEAYTELIPRRIWPPRADTKANGRIDWQKEWHSFPLEE